MMACLCALLLNQFLPEIAGSYLYLGAEANSTLTEVMTTWAVSQVKMSFMVALIIYVLMVIQRMLEAY